MSPISAVIADFNRDGKPDLAFGNYVFFGSASISILLGNGDGTFQPALNFPLPGTHAYALFTADFNLDKIPDLAVGGGYEVWIMLGNGDGTFQPVLTTSGVNLAIATADINGDGYPDLVGASSGPLIFLGKGDGTFQAPIEYMAGSINQGILGDFNGDGKLDLAFTNIVTTEQSVFEGQTTDTVVVMLGSGDGQFRHAGTYHTGGGPYESAMADFNRDGKIDWQL